MRLEFVKKSRIPNPVKSLETTSATARVSPDLLKALAILSDTPARRSGVDPREVYYLQAFQRFS